MGQVKLHATRGRDTHLVRLTATEPFHKLHVGLDTPPSLSSMTPERGPKCLLRQLAATGAWRCGRPTDQLHVCASEALMRYRQLR